MKWKRYYNLNVTGVKITGDPDSKPTIWWRHPWQALFGWDTIQTFTVNEQVAKKGWYIGYRDQWRIEKLTTSPLFTEMVVVRIGREPATFFAIDDLGHEAQIVPGQRGKLV